MKTYQIITYARESGYDEKQDCRTYKEARETAERYIKEWDEVYIIAMPEIKIMKIYDCIKPSGRRPYSGERFPFLYFYIATGSTYKTPADQKDICQKDK